MLPPALAGEQHAAAHEEEQHGGDHGHIHEVQLRGWWGLHRLTLHSLDLVGDVEAAQRGQRSQEGGHICGALEAL